AFDLPIVEAHAKIFAALKDQEAYATIFGPRPRSDSEGPQFAANFAVEDASDPVFAPHIVKDPLNRHDVYAHTYGTPIWPSPVYRGNEGGLPFLAAFQVHLSADGPGRTVVTVVALDTEVFNGKVWGVGSCGAGYFYNHESVRPTTVEEYQV